MAHDSALEQLLLLIEDYADFNSRAIRTLPIPDPVLFSKHVSRGLPCVFDAYRKASAASPTPPSDESQLSLPACAAFSWNAKDLISLVTDEVEVAVTPNGRADALHRVESEDQPVFLQPASVNMSMYDLLEKITGDTKRNETPVHYLQSQNSNLTDPSLAPLLASVPSNFSFARPVLGEPEAINIWIGDSRSVTSAHRDPYENLYLVVRGQKTFTLWPPVDEICLDARMVRTGEYKFDPSNESFSITLDEATGNDDDVPRIPWVSIDPKLSPNEIIREHPLYKHASPRIVTVEEGQMLYLPSGWYHHVQQECGQWPDGEVSPCIAVNYWYDIDYEGEKYVMRQLISRLVAQAQAAEEPVS